MLPTRKSFVLGVFAAVILLSGVAQSLPDAGFAGSLHAQQVTGPTRPLYLTGTRFGGGNVNEIRAIQDGVILTSWDTHGSSQAVPGYETALAVTTAVQTVGGAVCSPCGTTPMYTARYQLDGTFIGATTLTSLPQISPSQNDYLYDGTTDGTNNYALGLLSSTVYSFDADWENAQALFALPTPSGGGFWLGITYDVSNDSLWVSTHNAPGATIANYAMDGTLLSSFTPAAGYNLMTGLALDNEDGTLWVVRTNTLSAFATNLEQYSKTGTLLATVDDPSFQNFDSVGAEFPFTNSAGSPQGISVTQSAPASAVFGTSFGVAATATSGLIVEIDAAGACSINNSIVTMTSGTGDCTVTYTQPGDGTYAAAQPVVETTAALKAGQVIQVTQSPPSWAAFDTTFGVAATAPAGPVAITVTGVCSLASGTVTMTSGTGSCTTSFSQAGSSDYLAATAVDLVTTATKASQTITVVQGAPTSASFKDMIALQATAPGGPVSIAATGSCSLKGSTLTMKKATPKSSVCSVTFSQGGNADYATAPQVVQTTTVQ